eukprot:TRINITY_DN26728_c0_g1_i2.p1 TRINITY_DN26728_c0_g1~~TRINITY_DN26728_c0_g1_i2.p1  ORF type:complete len:283 (+),score=50.63 TRINITY_DN26728_c0_g1_i2:90-938(+)
MSLGLSPSSGGASLFWRCSEGQTGEVVFFVGNASNAAAACCGDLLGFQVSHIISVGSHRNLRFMKAKLRDWQQLFYHPLSDWQRPGDQVDISKELASPLKAIDKALGAGPLSLDGKEVPARAVLLHCDMGHNRSPTLALAFLVRHGLTLREAYRILLKSRPDVDPLPSYRQGLQDFELSCHSGLDGRCSVSSQDLFTKHVTELMRLPEVLAMQGTAWTGSENNSEKTSNKEGTLKGESDDPHAVSNTSSTSSISSESSSHQNSVDLLDIAFELRKASVAETS